MARLRNELKRSGDENNEDDENDDAHQDKDGYDDSKGDDENDGDEDEEDTGGEAGDDIMEESEPSSEDGNDTSKNAATSKKTEENTSGTDDTLQNDVQEDTTIVENSDHDPSSKKRKHLSQGDDEADPVESGARRVRRSRRQPILYNPQTCPASEWQSDGVFEWKNLSQSEKGMPDGAEELDSDAKDGTNGAQEATKDRNKKESPRKTRKDDATTEDEDAGPVWCTFCNDDPSIPVCCFCACRVCFGKHDGVSARALPAPSHKLLCHQI